MSKTCTKHFVGTNAIVEPLPPHCSHSNPSALLCILCCCSPACENIAAVYLFLGLIVFSLDSNAKDKLQGNVYLTDESMVVLIVQQWLSCFSDIWALQLRA